MKTMRDYLPVDQDDDSSDLPVTEAHNSSPLARRRLVLALVVSNVLTASALFFFLVSSVLQGRKELNGDLKRVSYYSMPSTSSSHKPDSNT